MFGSKSRLIQSLRAEIQRLREVVARLTGERHTLRKSYDDMRSIARAALEVAHKKEFPAEKDDLLITWTRRPKPPEDVEAYRVEYLPDADPHSVKNCPKCSVSVRATEWPQQCPNSNCRTWFGDELDADVIE